MKIIHCADIHLGSSLTANFDKRKADERKAELFTTFSKMFEYANNNSVGTIIIAGDLFDKDEGLKKLKNNVVNLIEKYPHISVYYTKGNHDNKNAFENIPSNLYFFKESDWTTYLVPNSKKIKITSIELNRNNKGYIYNTLNLKNDDFNIVVMHGQETNSDGKRDAETINLNSLKGRNIDYLALGHIHTYKETKLDNRCTYCYSGCLEGRGFDETGEHGFVLLDIDEDKHTYTTLFVPFSKRKIYYEEIDVSKATNTISAIDIIKDKIQNLNSKEESLAEFVLTGDLDLDVNIDEDCIYSKFKDDFYLLKIRSNYSIRINYKDFENDESLKGEFVRLVMNDNSINEEEKEKIIKYGLDALMGKELS